MREIIIKNNNIEKYKYHYLLGIKLDETSDVKSDIEFFKMYDSKQMLEICNECLLLNCTTDDNSNSKKEQTESEELNNFRYVNMTLKIESVMNDLVPCLIHTNDLLDQLNLQTKINNVIADIGKNEFINKAKIEI